MPDLLFMLMAQDRPSEMQLAAARCITFLHRAGAFTAEDPKILYRTLPCLVSSYYVDHWVLVAAGGIQIVSHLSVVFLFFLQVRLCKKDRPPLQRAQAAETLAYLTEVDIELQRTASISNHLILTLSELLKYQPRIGSKTPMITVEQEIKTSTEMRQAAFRVCYAN